MTDKSLTDAVSSILNEGNADTLKPGSQHKEPMKKLPDSEVENLGTGPVKVGQDNPDATKKLKKDKSKAAKSEVEAESMKKLKEESEDIEVDVELPDYIDEEILDHILQAMNEGHSFEDIVESLDETLTEDQLTDLVEHAEIFDQLKTLSESDENDDDEVLEEDVDDEVEQDVDLEIDLSEDVNALLSGEDLSENFKSKTKAIFEAAVRSRLIQYQKKLDEKFIEALNEATEEIVEEVSGTVDEYLEYMAEQWMQDNEVAIESSLKTELTEDFISGLRNLFSENYIDIPQEKVDVIEALHEKVVELEEKLNEEIETNVELTGYLKEAMKADITHDFVSGLSATQADKIEELAENIEFVSEEDFEQKLKTLKESYFPGEKMIKTNIESVEGSSLNESIEDDGRMSKYVSVLDRTVPKNTV